MKFRARIRPIEAFITHSASSIYNFIQNGNALPPSQIYAWQVKSSPGQWGEADDPQRRLLLVVESKPQPSCGHLCFPALLLLITSLPLVGFASLVVSGVTLRSWETATRLLRWGTLAGRTASAPAYRRGHGSCLLPDAKTLCKFKSLKYIIARGQ